MKKTSPCLFLVICVSMILLPSACAPASTPLPAERPAESLPAGTPEDMVNNGPLTLVEAEELAGFDVREPAHLPAGVSFDFATYQELPSPSVTLHYKIVHEQFGDMGAFLQIVQEPQSEAPPDMLSCGETTVGCELLQVGDVPIVYRSNPAGPEGLDWYEEGIAFRLLRTAGEPNKIYKEELLQIVDSME